MRKLVYLILATFVLTSCSRKERSNYTKEKKESGNEIASLFVNSVDLRNVKKRDNTDPQQFLNEQQLSVLQGCIKSFLENTPDKIITDPNWEPQDKKEILNRISDYKNLVKVDFYESWCFNSDNKMIEKDVLGYCIWDYVPSKEAYRQLYFVFKDDASLQKAKKLYFSN